MIKSIHIILSIFLTILTMSCYDNYDSINNFDSLKNETKVVLKLNKDLFDTIDSNRKINIQTGDAFDINHVKIEGDILKINLSYSGGCEQHEFEILWDGIIYTDDPCYMNLIVIHSGNGDPCEAYVTDTIDVNLKDLIGDNIYRNTCGYYIFSSYNSSENSDAYVEVIN